MIQATIELCAEKIMELVRNRDQVTFVEVERVLDGLIPIHGDMALTKTGVLHFSFDWLRI